MEEARKPQICSCWPTTIPSAGVAGDLASRWLETLLALPSARVGSRGGCVHCIDAEYGAVYCPLVDTGWNLSPFGPRAPAAGLPTRLSMRQRCVNSSVEPGERPYNTDD